MIWLTASLLSDARRAARTSDWDSAATAYEKYLAKRPRDARSWVQFGHAQKALGKIDQAIAAYDQSITLAPMVADTWLQKAVALKQKGLRAEAMDCCTHAVEIDSTFAVAIDELLALGARDRLPAKVIESMLKPAQTRLLDNAIDDNLRGVVYPPARYADYRRQLTILPPPVAPGAPEISNAGPIMVLIDGRKAIPADVRATLSSLRDQTETGWHAVVFAPEATRDHSVASLAAIDERIRFVPDDAVLTSEARGALAMLLAAGTVIDRQTIAWYRFAAERTGCVAVYCDHDQAIDHWQSGRSYDYPVLQPAYDPIWFESPDCTPALLMIDTSQVAIETHWTNATIADALLTSANCGAVAHLPLLLASTRRLAPEAARAIADPPRATNAHGQPVSISRSVADIPADRIQVIIQTRDQPELLDAAIKSMKRLAAQPGLIDWTIVDNRSSKTETKSLLKRLRRQKNVKIIAHDEPFNWSRANNVAAEQESASILLFANNDVEMLTEDWDNALREALAKPEVGLVGALLLYPDRTIQHAGMILGMGTGGPVHAGLGWNAVDPGPMGRFTRAHAASAVTGAFMAISRSLFESIGGFDAVELSIAFNDVDLCLKVREAGSLIVQTPTIRLIHYESKSRGFNSTRSQVAWDLDELGALHNRWGAALFHDPGYNPHWTHTGQPFDGYRFPPMAEILRHLDHSGRSRPWRAVRADQSTRPDSTR